MRSTINRLLFWIVALPLMLACALIAPVAIAEWTLARVVFAAVWVLVCAGFAIALYRSAYAAAPAPSELRMAAVPAPSERRMAAGPGSSELRMAQVMNGLRALLLWPLFAGEQLWSRGVFWRPVAILFFALGIVAFPVSAIFQILHNGFARALHARLGTTILVRSDGIELARAEHPTRLLQWSQLASIQVMLGRRFEEAGATITDMPSYQVVLQSGETLVADFVNEQDLLAACRERQIEVRQEAKSANP